MGEVLYKDLGLDRSLDPYHRAVKQEVTFKLFRVFTGNIYWSPFVAKSIALFYGEDTVQRDQFVYNIINQSKKFKESVNTHIVDLTGELKTVVEELGKHRGNLFTYKHFLNDVNSIVEVLEKLKEYRDDVRAETAELRVLEQAHRRLSIVFLNLSREQMIEIKGSQYLTSLLKDLMNFSDRERLYVVPITPSADVFPVDILKEVEWAGFLGDTNYKICKQLYPKKKESVYSKKQHFSGIVFSNSHRFLVVVHPLVYTPSTWGLEKERQIKNENEAFEKFLQSLDDGSIDE